MKGRFCISFKIEISAEALGKHGINTKLMKKIWAILACARAKYYYSHLLPWEDLITIIIFNFAFINVPQRDTLR